MWPNRALPPLLCCPGVSPIQAATCRPFLKSWPLPMLARSALAVMGPMPGRSISILTCCLGNGFIVIGNARIELISVTQQIVDAALGITRQIVQVFTDALAQSRHFLRQDDAEFGDQAAQTVIACGTLFDEALPGAVQA